MCVKITVKGFCIFNLRISRCLEVLQYYRFRVLELIIYWGFRVQHVFEIPGRDFRVLIATFLRVLSWVLSSGWEGWNGIASFSKS